MGLDFEKACHESSNISGSFSSDIIDDMYSKLGKEVTCDCGTCMEPPYDPDDLKECHWCSVLIENEIEDMDKEDVPRGRDQP